MKESILHYIWQQKLYAVNDLKTTDGESIEILNPGKTNTDAGPDFFNAKVKIGNTTWAGNVEIHIHASDWLRHKHHTDKKYDSVILHVVKFSDIEIFRNNGDKIPQLQLVYPERIEENYTQLISNSKWIPCADKISQVPSIYFNSWKTKLLTERLEQKLQSIFDLLKENNRNWEEAFYIILARSFGFGTNSDAFMALAKSLPLGILGKHKNDLSQIESLLFGQAGLLEDEQTDSYSQKLKKEYDFLRHKYSLKPIATELWKLLRLRPDNFPHIRIAQFAALVHYSNKLFSKIIENHQLEYLHLLFRVEPSEYWKNHYLFGHESPSKNKKLGLNSVNIILINTVIPFIFSYATLNGNQKMKDEVIFLLENIRAENNSVIRSWKETGVIVESAFDTQALLYLKKNYCDDKKCLRCPVVHQVLTINN